jgi:hypothetical protein
MLHTCSQATALALRPAHDALLESIAAKMAPYYDDPSFAVSTAMQTDMMRTFGLYMHRHFGQRVDTLTAAEQVVDYINELLSGQVNWQFTPKRQAIISEEIARILSR